MGAIGKIERTFPDIRFTSRTASKQEIPTLRVHPTLHDVVKGNYQAFSEFIPGKIHAMHISVYDHPRIAELADYFVNRLYTLARQETLVMHALLHSQPQCLPAWVTLNNIIR